MTTRGTLWELGKTNQNQDSTRTGRSLDVQKLFYRAHDNLSPEQDVFQWWVLYYIGAGTLRDQSQVVAAAYMRKVGKRTSENGDVADVW